MVQQQADNSISPDAELIETPGGSQLYREDLACGVYQGIPSACHRSARNQSIHKPSDDTDEYTKQLTTSPAHDDGVAGGAEDRTGCRLLEFMSEAGSDISAALHRAVPFRRCTDHRKFLQRQLRRHVTGNHSKCHSVSHSSCSVKCEKDNKKDVLAAVTHLNISGEHCLSGPYSTASTPGDKLTMQIDMHLTVEETQRQLDEEREDDVQYYTSGERRSPLSNDDDAGSGGLVHKPTADMTDKYSNSTASADGCLDKMKDFSDPLFERVHGFTDTCTPDITTPVPLRSRPLPASFWREPNVPRGHPCMEAYRQASLSQLVGRHLGHQLAPGVTPGVAAYPHPLLYQGSAAMHQPLLTSRDSPVGSFPGILPTSAASLTTHRFTSPDINMASLPGWPWSTYHANNTSIESVPSPSYVSTPQLGSWTAPWRGPLVPDHKSPGGLWRPIPTKRASQQIHSTRYHPFLHVT